MLAMSVDEAVAPDAAQKQLVLKICHYSLLRLGDLSRYRETELQFLNRNWGPARGYYSLAIAVLRASGAPYHQLAAIAQTDKDAFESVYYFYRALMQQKPHPNARANIERQFKKTRDLWSEPEKHNVEDGHFTHFQSRFVAFHAKCYFGLESNEHTDLETEIIHEITVTLLQGSEADLLNKICLMNIAAETTALERLAAKCKQ